MTGLSRFSGTSCAAVAAAAEAFPAWSATPLPKRMNYIFKIQQVMKGNLEMRAILTCAAVSPINGFSLLG
ncbi:aldehyde dehydrogenase family protein [Oceanospirillum beijerinckii]|uniref:aldehyde dehydrogenase family protein n=1 Tax=Oceanospirillum beijerinckii TaxID=64976 RepID=UPI0012FEC870